MMRDAFHEIERARSALWSLDPGADRETWVRHAMAAKAAGLGFDDFHNWSEGAGNYQSEAECRSVWKSIKDGGVTAASLFRAAMANGWTDDAKPRTERPQSPQKEPEPTKPSKPPLYDPATLWSACKPVAASHEYIARKLGVPDGLRIYSGLLTIAGQSCDGALVLPCFSLAGALVSLQFIPIGANAKKVFLPGCKLPPDACLIIGGPIVEGCPVYICEGIGQAWSAMHATGAPAVVCFGAARMASVAKALREHHKGALPVLVADGGKEHQMAAIARDISGAWVQMPEGSASNYDLNDYHQEHGPDAVRALLEQSKAPARRFNLLSDDDLCKLPPQQWRVKKVLPVTGLAAVFGASGSGKSFLVIDMAQAIAAGRDWFGFKSKPCNVLYCALEGEGGIAGRVSAYRAHHGETSPNVRYMADPFNLLGHGDIAGLADAIKATGQGAEVVILDTLNRAAPGADENSSQDMGNIITAAKELQRLIGGLVILVHHTGKNASAGLRGHSSLHAALDAAIEVRRDGDRREWLSAKVKEGEDGQTHPFKLEVLELGIDEDAEVITSCVAVPDNEPGGRAKQKRLTAGQRQGITAYCTAANDGLGELDAAGNFAGLQLETWRESFYRTSTADNTDSKKKAFQRVRNSLQDDGLLSAIDDVYRITDPSASVQEGGFTKAIRNRDTGQSRDIGGTCPDQDRDGTGHVSINMSRCPDGGGFGKDLEQ